MCWAVIVFLVVEVLCFVCATGDCYISELLRNGWVEYQATEQKLSHGERVADSVSISYKCNTHHIIDGQPTNFCFQGKWANENPKCVPRCSTRSIHGTSIQPSCCTLNGEVVDCARPIKPGTIAYINCRNRYERIAGSPQQTVVCQKDGEWLPAPQVCTAKCGEEFPSGTPYIVNGHEVNITVVPWHAGIYQNNDDKFDYICGGSIINTRVVISAMHCFWDSSIDKPYEATLYRVGVGKSLLNFNAIEKYKEQKYGVQRFVYPPGYADYANNYQADLVLLILSGNIEFDAHVAPVCVPYGLQFNDINVPSGWSGRVGGWGLTSSGGQPSQQLKYLEVPTVDPAQCRKDSTAAFRPQVTSDKFCAGLLNANVSLCQGDSGGGLAVATEERNRKVFYLRGVVSTGPSLGSSCNSNQYTTFTNILYYEKMILDTDTFYSHNINDTIGAPRSRSVVVSTPSDEKSNSCEIAKIPRGGWIQLDAPGIQVLYRGDIVDDRSVVTYKCEGNYSLDGQSLNFCRFGRWRFHTPDCVLICNNKVVSDMSLYASCLQNGKEKVGRCDAIVLVTISASLFYSYAAENNIFAVWW